MKKESRLTQKGAIIVAALGRFRDAQHTVDIIAEQYQALPDKKTEPDRPELESRHVRGRTIYAVPDRVVYGYFDMLTRRWWNQAARAKRRVGRSWLSHGISWR